MTTETHHGSQTETGWKQSKVYKSPIFKSFVAGALSGTCSTVVLQPLDLVKTRLQSSMVNDSHQRATGMFKTIVQIVRHERFFGLWRGVFPSLFRTVPGVGFYFCSLNWIQHSFRALDPTPLQAVCQGTMARCLAGLLLLPITVVKTRFESKAYTYRSTLGALRSIYKLEGRRGLYSGLVATMCRDAPFSGIYLMFYTSLKKIVTDTDKAKGSLYYTGINFSCGVLAGVMASVTTQPADVIKTHMQLYPKRHNTIFTTVQFIIKENGFTGFFKGIAPRCIRRALMAALAWTVYEEAIVKLNLK